MGGIKSVWIKSYFIKKIKWKFFFDAFFILNLKPFLINEIFDVCAHSDCSQVLKNSFGFFTHPWHQLLCYMELNFIKKFAELTWTPLVNILFVCKTIALKFLTVSNWNVNSMGLPAIPKLSLLQPIHSKPNNMEETDQLELIVDINFLYCLIVSIMKYSSLIQVYSSFSQVTR